jgi:hypothetical protein
MRVSPVLSLRGPENERTSMGNTAVVEELAGVNDLEDLYEVDASENSPEDEEDEGDEEDNGDEDVQPEEIPHE